MEEAPLKAYRGQARIFKRLDTVAKYVHQELGVYRFDVETANWSYDGSLIWLDG